LKENITEDLEFSLQSDLLKKLQEEFLDSTEEFSYNDSNLMRPNHLITTFLFDPLNGNFTESISNSTDYENKVFSMESKHHEAGGKPASLTLMKTKPKKNLVTLEGNPKLSSEDNIEDEKKKWSEICFQACDDQDLPVLDLQSLNDVVNSSRNMLDLVNLTSLITEKQEKIDENQNVSLQYNHFWLSFAKHVRAY